MIRFVTFLAVLLTGLPAQASAASEFEGGVVTLVEVMSRHVGRLDRPLVTYRYSQDADFKPRAFADVRARLEGRPEIFFDPNQSGQMAGPGTYLAMDPVNSREYGGDLAQLFVITLNTDTKVLDLDGLLSKAELARLRALNARLKCGAIPLGLTEVVDTFRNSAEAACKAIAFEAFRRLDIGAIAYAFVTPTSFVGCRESREAAINVISSRAIDFDQLEYYSNTDHFGPSRLAPYTRRLYDLAAADTFAKTGDHPQMPVKLEGSRATEADFEGWKAGNIFGCGPLRAAEGSFADSNRYLVHLKREYRDAEIQTLLDQARKAVTGKFVGAPHSSKIPNLRLGNINWVMRLSYLSMIGRPADISFENWTAGSNLINDLQALSQDANGETASLGRLLGESAGVFREVSRADLMPPVPRMLAAHRPVDLLAMFGRTGFGPRAARILINVSLEGVEGVPFLVWPNAHRTEREAFDQSRSMIKNILTVCLVKYRDPAVSPDELQRTWCGIDTSND